MTETFELIQRSFVHAAGVFFYTVLVAAVLTNAQRIFGPMPTIWGGVAFLMLFVVSASIVGSLVLVKPAMLYLGNAKKQGVLMLVYTVGWLCAVTILVLFARVA